ncbi:MAG: DHH family phosphoesterase [Candidatus Micrarchaeota archaeon]|nr:DHH family phosphoesterase [Candidatus Micrarchaeota archaeon]
MAATKDEDVEMIGNIVDIAKTAAKAIKEYGGTIRLASHYDADGISSAAIIALALHRLGKRFRLSLFRQLEENYIKDLGSEKCGMYIITDMGSGQLKNIQKYIKDATIIICDHHQKQGKVEREDIIHLNSLEAGIGENISGSGVSYILARAIDDDNADLSQLAIVGAIGDSQIDSIGKKWGLVGMNREILKDAENSGKIRITRGIRLWGRYTRPLHKALEYTMDPFIPGISGSEDGTLRLLNELGIPVKNSAGKWRTLADLSEDEQKKLAGGIIIARINGRKDNPDEIFGDVYELLDRNDEFRDASEFATMLNSCGKTGKADLGVRLCINDATAADEVRKTISEYRRMISASVKWVQEQIEKRSDNVIFGEGVYVIAGSNIPEDIISNVMSIVNHSGMAPKDKPLFGFASQDTTTKVSARLGKGSKKSINLKELLSIAAKSCGGEGGGHEMAAGARIPSDCMQKFITFIENELKQIKNTQN